MQTKSDLGFISSTISSIENYYNQNPQLAERYEGKYRLFLSIGNESIRACVIQTASENLAKAFIKLQQKAEELVAKRHLNPQWIKVDIVSEIEPIRFTELEKKIARTRRNYFRWGIAFDSDFRLAFLEQEINGNAIIRSYKKGPQQLDDKNMNHYISYKHGNRLPFFKNAFANKNMYIFKTHSVFVDREDGELRELYNGDLTNGIRKTDNIKEEVSAIIHKATHYLSEQVQFDGKFEYGYFANFAKKIGTYNILRHSSSLYSLAEGYEIVQDPKIIEAVKRGIEYLIREAIVYKEPGVAFAVDYANGKEIKLGSNATAILAITKYTEVTRDATYIEVAQSLARGILEMKTPSGGFMHVLTYPSYEIKDLYRIIYYEGEAIFSLLRLYAIDKQEVWLEEVKKSFDYFIKNDYWKHHDHWLSYAANELTDYIQDDDYFIFGLKNCQKKLDFIFHRETTFPTFLELTMAAYKMVGKIKVLHKNYLLEHIDEAFLEKTIEQRAEYQRVGFYYPELAMYTKEPQLILSGFFIRHHAFRVRIDDVEHYLSGYCQYLRYRAEKSSVPFSVNTGQL